MYTPDNHRSPASHMTNFASNQNNNNLSSEMKKLEDSFAPDQYPHFDSPCNSLPSSPSSTSSSVDTIFTTQWRTGVTNTAFQGAIEPVQELNKEQVATIVMGAKGRVVYTKNGDGRTERFPLLQYDVIPSGDPTEELRKDPSSFHISKVILFVLLVGAGLVMVSGLVFGITSIATDLPQEDIEKTVILESQTEARSTMGNFRFAAVATDAGQCSTIGTHIMAEKRGSVVDAAIASLLCLGIHNAHSMGIGGGHFMMIYARPAKGMARQMFSLDARETAPGAANVYKFFNVSSVVGGGLSIGVPGEIKGMYAAWSRFGRLPWKELFKPVLHMCREGYQVGAALGTAIMKRESSIRQQKMLTELYVKPDGTLYKEGDIMTSPRLADTLEKIAEEGPHVFYNGTLADDIISDIKECGGIISKKDLVDYTAIWRTPSVSTLKNGNYSVNAMPPPSSGPVMQYMLNILEGYNLTAADIEGSSAQRTLTYHRIAETFKFGYAQRSFLSDPNFNDMNELIQNLTSRSYADLARSRIRDKTTKGVEYYHPINHALPKAAGTSHMSIIGPDGEAVAVTSTINTKFGSKCRGERTGIIFNDEMDDFNKPGDQAWNGHTASTANFIQPGKRPLSSMVPTIILDKEGHPVFVVGGSGGLHITAGVTYVTAHALWLGKKLNEAIDQPRIHHQLLPNVLNYETRFDKEVIHGLANKGHVLKETKILAVIQGIYSCRPHCPDPGIFATSDFRKGGYPDGY